MPNMSLILLLLPKQLLLIFLNSNSSSTTIDYGVSFIYIVAPFFILMEFKIPCDGVLKGSRDIFGFMFGTLLDLILRVILSFILNHYLGYIGIFIAWPISWCVGAICSILFILKGRWKKLALWPDKEAYLSEKI